MINKEIVTLIYIEEGVKESGSPLKAEHEKEIICDERGSFSFKYYTEQDRDMKSNNNLSISFHHTLDYNNGQLRYVKFNSIKYEVVNILQDRRRGKMFRLLDITEYKGV